MTRRRDWVIRLEWLLREHAATPFAYGSWDCCLFACAAIEAMTGEDLAAEFRGHYDSWATARYIMASYAGKRRLASVAELVELVTKRAGMVEVQPAYARRGDVLLVRGTGGYSLGVVALDGIRAVVTGGHGLMWEPREIAKRAWQV